MGVVLIFLSCATSYCQVDSVARSYRLEKLGVMSCNLGGDKTSKNARIGGQLDFRVGPNDNFYFLDYNARKLQRFDSSGKFLRSVPVGGSLSHFRTGFDVGPEGDVFVLDGGQNVLYRYDAALDLLGRSRVENGGELEWIHDFAATSWGELLAVGEGMPNFWKLEPVGKNFMLKPVNESSPVRYVSLSEMSGARLLAADILGQFNVLDRYGNVLRSWPCEKGTEAAAIGGEVFVFNRANREMRLLDSTGAFLSSWEATELEPEMEKALQFQVVRDKIYFLLSVPDKIIVFQHVRSDANAASAEKKVRE